MPPAYLERLAALRPDLRQPFAPGAVNVMLEIGVTSAAEAAPGPDGIEPARARLESVLADEIEAGRVEDAALAGSEAHRLAFWAMREAASEVMLSIKPNVATDIALPLDGLGLFFDQMRTALDRLDPGAHELSVAHLGDGNIHYVVYPTRDDPALAETIVEAVEDQVCAIGGSFSAEHGIGLSKKSSMARRKDPVALEVMRAIKAALDPQGIMNPGKVLPD